MARGVPEGVGVNRYFDELVRCRCAPELLALKLFPNAKEITETFAAYAAVREHFAGTLAFGRACVAMLAVGDGHVPRTAATFALRSAWTCFSVDPAMREEWTRGSRIARLHAYRDQVLNVGGWYPEAAHELAFTRCIVVAVHSHASLRASVQAAKALAERVSVVSIPCCVPDDIGPPTTSYEDTGITSRQRRVNVWEAA